MHPAQQATLARFVAACHSDQRVIVAFLGGSYAAGTSDPYSDLDLYLITTDEGYRPFFTERHAFLRQVGEPVFQEDFNDFGFDMIVYLFRDGVEGELALGRESTFETTFAHHLGDPFTLLVDKNGLLAGKSFPPQPFTPAAQQAFLRHLLYWFWRNVSQCATALARNHLWTAHSFLEQLRCACVNLVRLRDDPSHWPAGYEKLERVAPEEQLDVLHRTFVPLERTAFLQALTTYVAFYREHAIPLAESHHLLYPAKLDQAVCDQVEKRCQVQLRS